MIGYIYRIWNDINNKSYIGKTAYSIEQRWKEHCQDYKKKRCEKRPLYSAMNKYGLEHFHIELIEECSLSELADREIYWIGFYHTYSDGYNATKGGDGKILYDYDYIIKRYNQGLKCYQIAEELSCDTSVIGNALKKVGIDPHQNAYDASKKPLKAIFKDGTEKNFSSTIEAAHWLMDNNFTQATVLKGVSTNISRVANGKQHRKSYLGIKWIYI